MLTHCFFRFVDRGTRPEAWNSSDFHVRLRISRIRKSSLSTANIKRESVHTFHTTSEITCNLLAINACLRGGGGGCK